MPSHHLSRCGRCLPQRLLLCRLGGDEVWPRPLLAEVSGWARMGHTSGLNTRASSRDFPARIYLGATNHMFSSLPSRYPREGMKLGEIEVLLGHLQMLISMFSLAARSPSDRPGSERNTNCTDEAPQLTAPGSGAEMQFLHPPPSLRHWRQRYLCLVDQNICLPEASLQVFIYHYYEIRLSRFHYAA